MTFVKGHLHDAGTAYAPANLDADLVRQRGLLGHPARQLALLAFLRDLNQEHFRQHDTELDLEARIASYELAARMQTAAKEAMDVSSESEATRKLYGLDNDLTKRWGEPA